MQSGVITWLRAIPAVTLARLKRILPDQVWDSPAVTGAVESLVGGRDWDLEAVTLLAALYAWHPHQYEACSFAGAVHTLKTEHPQAWKNVYNPRFHGLLDAEWEQFPRHLFYWVKILEQHSIAFDWAELLADLSESHKSYDGMMAVRKRWATTVWAE